MPIENGTEHKESDQVIEDWQDNTSLRSKFLYIVENFTPLWFTLCMNTGILGVLMHQLPYQFNGLGIISAIMFVFDLVLFIAMFIIFALRCILYPRSIIEACKTDLVSLAMLGAVPIAFFTLTAEVALVVTTASWGGHAWFLVAYVMWWIGTFVMLAVALVVIVVFSSTEVTSSKTITPTLVIPFVGTATDAVVGALIVNSSDGVTARLAIPVIVVSYILAGIGFWAAMLIYALYFTRLVDHGLPAPEQSPSLVLLVGPSGQSAAAAQLLGTAALKHFGNYSKGTFLTDNAGMVCSVVGVVLALMFVGLGILFLAFAIYVMARVAYKRQHKYSLIWWSTIFPVATINTAWISFADAMDSPAFRVLATIFLIVLVIDYLINWVYTLRDIYRGKLLSRMPPQELDRRKAN